MKKNLVLVLSLLFLTAFSASAQSIVINEVLASNNTINTDEDGSRQDWIELYNTGSTVVNLMGYGLSDDPAVPLKWVFPNISVPAGGYLLVWCSDKNRTNPASPLHTNFKISASGETIALNNPSGSIVDAVPAMEIPADVSYGRLPNGTGSFSFFDVVTPAAANSSTGYSEALSPPTFSQEAGFYTTSFTLNLSTSTPGATILYTVDGSEPDAAHIGGTTYQYKNQYAEDPGQVTGPLLTQSFETLQYSAPITIIDRTPLPNKIASISSTMSFNPSYIPTQPIFKGTVVRAKVVKPGALSSTVESRTYFVTPQGSNRFSLPVVSISITEKTLYDYNDGIYVAGVDFDTWRAANPTVVHHGIENIANFYRRGMAHERVGNFSYFVNGEQVINQDVGFRIHGGSSREWQNKSFNIYARADYGDDTMNYAFFPGVPTDFDRLILRNSGADFYETLFRDGFIHRLMKNLNVLTKDYQPTITFMNGEYWGILNLRDKFDNNYFTRVFDIPEGQLDITANQNTVEEGDNVHYAAMYSYINNNSLAVPANYEYVKTQMDPESFADYYISNIFFQNIDWPGNNVARWRKKTTYDPNAPFGHDGRWRWLAHDLDATFATRSHNIALNSLAAATATNGPSWPNPAWSTLLLRKMLENETFKHHFISRFADLMNTSFHSARVISVMTEMKNVILPEMPEQIARWDAPTWYDWNNYLGEQVDFANLRPGFQRTHIREKFNITSNINTTINVSDAAHGHVKVNTIEIKEGTDGIAANPYPWTGIYFSNIPVTLKAIAAPGYVFSHWTGASDSTEAEIVVNSATDFAATAVFIPDTTPQVNVPVYFWMMDDNIANNTPLESLDATFEVDGLNASIEYESSLAGYPFTSTHPNWRKASMERRNNPTPVNYIPEANNNIPYATSEMKGLQIKEPFQSAGMENTMILHIPTTGYEDIKLSFAVANEQTNVTALAIDYSTESTQSWTTSGMSTSIFPLSASYQPIEIDFSSIATTANNANMKVRIRFTGTNLEVDNGNRVTFNNIALRGTDIALSAPGFAALRFAVYPNPTSGVLNVSGANSALNYKIYTIDGRRLGTGTVISNASIDVSGLTKGIYLLELEGEGKTEIKKIIRN